MKAEIISIGDELLLGQVIDTNSAWIGQELNKIGIHVHYKSSVSDSKYSILEALTESETRSNIVVITGGLGPTKDDITKTTLCDFFGTSLVLNEDVLKWVQSIFKNRNLPMLDSNNQQAMVPENCEVLWNRNGTAPGMWLQKNNTVYISLPGVPFEMKCIFEEEVIPKLFSTFSFPSILHRTLQTIGIGESFLAKKISTFEDKLPSHIKLAYLPSVGMVRLRLSAYGENQKLLQAELDLLVNNLYELISDYIYGEGNDTIEEVIGHLLKEKNQSVATAESCTGGYLSHMITSVPGSSEYYLGSIISYSNKIKTSELFVSDDLLKEHGAVSEACVLQMATAIKEKFGSTYGIATSGIAGPGGGSIEKPVGTVWVAISGPKGTKASVYSMGDNRGRTVHRTALVALDLLRKELLSN
jgi:nicotinamide-nucleotide amidase